MSNDEVDEDDDYDLFYSGLVNISGTYCFLNSVLQVRAVLAYAKTVFDLTVWTLNRQWRP